MLVEGVEAVEVGEEALVLTPAGGGPVTLRYADADDLFDDNYTLRLTDFEDLLVVVPERGTLWGLPYSFVEDVTWDPTSTARPRAVRRGDVRVRAPRQAVGGVRRRAPAAARRPRRADGREPRRARPPSGSRATASRSGSSSTSASPASDSSAARSTTTAGASRSSPPSAAPDREASPGGASLLSLPAGLLLGRLLTLLAERRLGLGLDRGWCRPGPIEVEELPACGIVGGERSD